VSDRLCSRRAYTRLEPDDGKPSSPVLRGGSGRDAASLPDSLEPKLLSVYWLWPKNKEQYSDLIIGITDKPLLVVRKTGECKLKSFHYAIAALPNIAVVLNFPDGVWKM